MGVSGRSAMTGRAIVGLSALEIYGSIMYLGSDQREIAAIPTEQTPCQTCSPAIREQSELAR
jgi:hypothetical protein